MGEGKYICITHTGWWCLTARPPSLPHQNRQNPPLCRSLSTSLPFHSHTPIYSSPCLHLLSVGLPPNAQPKQRLSGWRLWTWVWGLAGAEFDAFGTGWEMPSTSLVWGTAELFMMPQPGGKAQAYWQISQAEPECLGDSTVWRNVLD